MSGVVGGSVAAILWGLSSVVAARSSRLVGAEVALAWVYVVGLAAVLPVAVAVGLPDDVDGSGVAWTPVTVVMAVTALYAMYAALRRGPVSLVVPITASQGALAALVAVGLGERLGAFAWVGLAIVVLGMYAAIRRPRGAFDRAHPSAAIALAALSAVLSAFALYGGARAGAALGAAWLLVALRVAGVLSVTAPLALTRRLPGPGRALPLVVFSGLADSAAFASYVIAATRAGVAVPAVIASQFAAVSAVIGVAVLGERLTRVQLSGVVAILGGVAIVTAFQA